MSFAIRLSLIRQSISKEVRDVLKQSPKVFPLWDPMGALA